MPEGRAFISASTKRVRTRAPERTGEVKRILSKPWLMAMPAPSSGASVS